MGSANNSFGTLGVINKAAQASIYLPSVYSQIIVRLEATDSRN